MSVLLDPKTLKKDSKMPQHGFLFEQAEKDEQRQPTREAEALVDYLLSLKSANYPLPEAPVDQPFTSSMPKPATAPAEAADTAKPDEAGK